MPSADPKSEATIRFSSKEEKDHYKAKAKEESNLPFTKWGAQLVREHFKGLSQDSPLVLDLKKQVEGLVEEHIRIESENLYLRNVLDSKSKELIDVRARVYSSPKTYSADLFDLMYSWFQDNPKTTRKDLINHIQYAIKIPNLVDNMRSIEMQLVSQGIIEIKDGVIYSKVGDSNDL